MEEVARGSRSAELQFAAEHSCRSQSDAEGPQRVVHDRWDSNPERPVIISRRPLNTWLSEMHRWAVVRICPMARSGRPQAVTQLRVEKVLSPQRVLRTYLPPSDREAACAAFTTVSASATRSRCSMKRMKPVGRSTLMHAARFPTP